MAHKKVYYRSSSSPHMSLAWQIGEKVDEDSLPSVSLEELEKRKYFLYKLTNPFVQDKRLGRVRDIFSYDGEQSVYLEHSPTFLKGGSLETLARRKVKLKPGIKKFILPKRYYLLDESI
jgi:hypothetical protein